MRPTRPLGKNPEPNPLRDLVFEECDKRMHQAMSANAIVTDLLSTGPLVKEDRKKLTPIVLAWLQLQNVRWER